MTFEAGVNLITFTVTIRDEELAEPTEEFYIDLESLSPSAVIKGCPSSATVYILNDDCKFAPMHYTHTRVSKISDRSFLLFIIWCLRMDSSLIAYHLPQIKT